MATKRALRSNTVLGDDGSSTTTGASTGPPPAKKRKVEAPRYECFGCGDDLLGRAFPKYNPTEKCDHLINFCKDCLRDWVESQVEGNLFKTGGEEGKNFGISCPQCPELMLESDVKMVSRASHGRFVEMERKHIADITPGWRWCLASGCKEGQVHEGEVVELPKPKAGDKKKKKGKGKAKEAAPVVDVVDVVDICTCNKCGAQACVPCDRPYHEGETCSDYQARIKDRLEEEDKSIAAIQRNTRKCPHCKKSIEKNGGCNSMWCSQCQHTFCWACVSVFRRGENGIFGCACVARRH